MAFCKNSVKPTARSRSPKHPHWLCLPRRLGAHSAPRRSGVAGCYLAEVAVVLVFNAKSGAKSRHDKFVFFRLVPGVVTLRRHQLEKAGAQAGVL
jgi:hypothetical protein